MQSLKTLHDLMFSVAHPVVVLTTTSKSTSRGITLTSFNFVSFNPPIISFCLNRPSRTAEILLESPNFAINILNPKMAEEATHFSNTKTQSQFPFPHDSIKFQNGNLILLKNSNSVLFCSMHSWSAIGDHDVFYGNVDEILNLSNSKPLLYYEMDYYTIERLSSSTESKHKL